AFEKKIAQLIIMGGAVQTKGNVGPDFVSEYNFFLDPKAASIVCSSSIPIKLVSLDGCRQLAFDKTQSLKIPDNPYGIIIKKIIKNNQNDFQYFYDPLAASVIINPSIASFTKRQSCTVIQKGKNRGKIVQADNPIKNIRVINKVNTMLFYSLLNSIMKRELLKF
ncbi:MAG: Inosine/uridine-preferring nucleoside hydrolase, partial [Microgenomates group bacterium GW2011_GWC1_43_11]